MLLLTTILANPLLTSPLIRGRNHYTTLCYRALVGFSGQTWFQATLFHTETSGLFQIGAIRSLPAAVSTNSSLAY